MSRPKALLFDFDGTIIDTEWPAFVTVRDVYVSHGLELSMEVWQQRIGRADAAHWTDHLGDMLGRQLDSEAYDVERRPRKNALTEQQPLRGGIERLIGAGIAAGVSLAVASSSPFSWVGGHLDRRDLRQHFQAVTTIDDVEKGKPWPDLFLHAASAVGVDPADALVIEDSEHGLHAAKAAGMTCIVVPNATTQSQDFRAADLVLNSLADLDLEDFDLQH